MNITISFKEKHICYIANHIVTSSFLRKPNLLFQLRDKVNVPNLTPDSLIEITVDVNELFSIHEELGMKQEGKVSLINKTMKDELLPQLLAKAADVNDVEQEAAAFLLGKLQARSDSFDLEINNETSAGRAMLTQ